MQDVACKTAPCARLTLSTVFHSVTQCYDTDTVRLQLFTLHADYKATDESAPVNAKKEIKLLRLPRILVLHMCRFTYNSQGLTKLHKQMQFSLKLRWVHTARRESCVRLSVFHCTVCCCFGSTSAGQLQSLIKLLCSTSSTCNVQVLG